jgi:hypothetical protein
MSSCKCGGMADVGTKSGNWLSDLFKPKQSPPVQKPQISKPPVEVRTGKLDM